MNHRSCSSDRQSSCLSFCFAREYLNVAWGRPELGIVFRTHHTRMAFHLKWFSFSLYNSMLLTTQTVHWTIFYLCESFDAPANTSSPGIPFGKIHKRNSFRPCECACVSPTNSDGQNLYHKTRTGGSSLWCASIGCDTSDRPIDEMDDCNGRNYTVCLLCAISCAPNNNRTNKLLDNFVNKFHI